MKPASIMNEESVNRIGSAVALLRLHKKGYPPKFLKIFPNDEFDVGRAEIQQAWQAFDLTMSVHHVRVRCVVYEEDCGSASVPPMIYVCLLSSASARLYLSPHAVDPDTDLLISSSDGYILLNHQDTLQLTPSVSITLKSCNVDQPDESILSSTCKAELRQFSSQFLVTDRLLGAGGQASVVVAVRRRDNRQLACKVIPLDCQEKAKSHHRCDFSFDKLQTIADTTNEEMMQRRICKVMAREFDVLRSLDHPNIIRLEKVICTEFHIYIFQELATGGDLMSYLDRRGALSEPQTVVIVRQVLEAVQHLHRNNIVHRDIKPENILMTSWNQCGRVILTDFGQARTLGTKTTFCDSALFRMRSLVGTCGYAAPELFPLNKENRIELKGYGKAVDMWSIGCVAGTILTNNVMFPDHEIRRPIANKRKYFEVSFNTAWQGISHNAISFVKGCLAFSENDRLTAQNALSHRWIRHPQYRIEVDEAYHRAVQSWLPRVNNDSWFESISTVDLGGQELLKSESATAMVDPQS